MSTGNVVIVGGTQGLGRELAQSYADEGRDVVVTGRDQARAEAAATEIGGKTSGIGFDLAEPHTIAERLAGVGDVDYLVLAAIERDTNSVRDYDIAGALRLVTLKLVGYTEVIHALLPRLRTASSILIFGGLARDRPYPGLDDGDDGQRRRDGPGADARHRAGADARERDAPGDRRRQPAVARHASGEDAGACRPHPDRAPGDDGRGRRRRALPARERGDQRHRASQSTAAGSACEVGRARRGRGARRRSRLQPRQLGPAADVVAQRTAFAWGRSASWRRPCS